MLSLDIKMFRRLCPWGLSEGDQKGGKIDRNSRCKAEVAIVLHFVFWVVPCEEVKHEALWRKMQTWGSKRIESNTSELIRKPEKKNRNKKVRVQREDKDASII